MSASPEAAIERIAKLRHRIGALRTCRCEDCRALVQVVALAREAIAMKRARRTVRSDPPLYIAPGIVEKFRLRDVPDTLGDPLE